MLRNNILSYVHIDTVWCFFKCQIICRAYGGYLANINDIHEQHVIETVVSRNIGKSRHGPDYCQN